MGRLMSTGKKRADVPVSCLLTIGNICLRVWATNRGLCRIQFVAIGGADGEQSRDTGSDALAHLARACNQLREYFDGKRRRFDVPIDLPACTPFQCAVWRGCSEIPFGERRSYGELAAAIGRPRAARAVGNALNSNPIPIIIPCHRVIRADGSLGGFGSGLRVKKSLLRREQANGLREF